MEDFCNKQQFKQRWGLQDADQVEWHKMSMMHLLAFHLSNMPLPCFGAAKPCVSRHALVHKRWSTTGEAAATLLANEIDLALQSQLIQRNATCNTDAGLSC